MNLEKGSADTFTIATLKALSIVPTTPEHAILPSRPRSPDIAPASAVQEAYTPTDRDAYQVLSVPELLVLVREYRGSVDGLERLSRRDLTTLLEHYKVDQESNDGIIC